jgi:hypothetical protein
VYFEVCRGSPLALPRYPLPSTIQPRGRTPEKRRNHSSISSRQQIGRTDSRKGRAGLLESSRRRQEFQGDLKVKEVASEVTTKQFLGLADSVADGVGMDSESRGGLGREPFSRIASPSVEKARWPLNHAATARDLSHDPERPRAHAVPSTQRSVGAIQTNQTERFALHHPVVYRTVYIPVWMVKISTRWQRGREPGPALISVLSPWAARHAGFVSA